MALCHLRRFPTGGGGNLCLWAAPGLPCVRVAEDSRAVLEQRIVRRPVAVERACSNSLYPFFSGRSTVTFGFCVFLFGGLFKYV